MAFNTDANTFLGWEKKYFILFGITVFNSAVKVRATLLKLSWILLFFCSPKRVPLCQGRYSFSTQASLSLQNGKRQSQLNLLYASYRKLIFYLASWNQNILPSRSTLCPLQSLLVPSNVSWHTLPFALTDLSLYRSFLVMDLKFNLESSSVNHYQRPCYI